MSRCFYRINIKKLDKATVDEISSNIRARPQ